MPQIKLPQSAANAIVRRWLKKPGEAIAKGDLLLELESEQGLVQVESPVAGKLLAAIAAVGKPLGADAALADVAEGAAQATAPLPAPTAAGPKPANAATAPPGGKVIPILMPKAGQSMEEGTIVKWHVQPGAQISKGQVIFEVETDKATMDVEATDSGRLAKIVLPEGGVLPVLQPVAFLADNDADVEAFLAAGGGGATSAGATQDSPQQRHRGTEARRHEGEAPPAVVTEGGRVKASPAAREIAAEKGIDLAAVGAGSGPGGRILSTDVQQYTSSTRAASPASRVPPASPAAVGAVRKKLSKMRRAIAENLLISKQTIPHFYIRTTINAEPLYAFYQGEKAKYQCSINDVVVLACSRLLMEFPAVRSRIERDEIIEFPSANVGVAVGLDEGLAVPVLLNVQNMSLQQIGSETKRIANAARSGKLENVGQGVFTITNLGMFGVEEFAAIVNPPEAAILAVGAIREQVIVSGGMMRPGKVMTMTFSCDHRIVDGMLAANFMKRLKEMLENPASIA